LRLAEEEGYYLRGVDAALGLSVVRLLQDDLAGHDRLLVKAKEPAAAETHAPQASIYLVEAAANFAGEDYGEAYRLADEAASECRRTGDAFTYGVAAILAAQAALAAGKRDKGREGLGQPALERRARESKVFSAHYNLTAGKLIHAEGDLERARKRFLAAAAAARESGLWLVRGECYLELAGIAEHENEREKYRRRALWLLESRGATLLAGKAKKKAGLL